MKKIIILSFILSTIIFSSVQATFSIVAVDTLTGTVGGAGASCIDNAQIINDLVEGVGGVHTQAYWLELNQDNAHDLLVAGHTPDSIIGWLENNDAQNKPGYRQYGVVTLAGQGASAGYTGFLTDSYTNHITGPGYAIQGNILLGPEILADMESAFLTTVGPLEEKLMAALEAAKVPGADTRCLSSNKSAISAFIKVIKIGDGSTPFLYKAVTNTSGETDPIDLLRGLYDTWKISKQTSADQSSILIDNDILKIGSSEESNALITLLDAAGIPPAYLPTKIVPLVDNGNLSSLILNPDGTYSFAITPGLVQDIDTVACMVVTNLDTIFINNAPEITYFICGDMNFSGGIPVISDLTFLVDYLFKNGIEPYPKRSADLNSDTQVGISDLTFMVEYLFSSGPEPGC